jgi:fructokinase
MNSPHTIVGLGEILWDIFPNGKKLGGAPANFAYISSLLGERGIVASRIGNDDLGREVLQQLSAHHLATSCLQSDPQHPTGAAKVSLDANGQASFEIISPVAWDFFQLTPDWTKLAQKADAVCFGTLAQRSPQSQKTIQDFLSATPPAALHVFDVNLRQSFYSAQIILDSIKKTHILKLNSEELPIILSLLGQTFPDEISGARWLQEKFQLKMVCLTRASRGSLLLTANAYDEHPGIPVKVIDTVGAGDAFTAALVYHFLRGASLSAMNIAANRMGTWVASQFGAMPPPNPAQLEQIRYPEKAFQPM